MTVDNRDKLEQLLLDEPVVSMALLRRSIALRIS